MSILAIETSCDETACAVVRDGREILSNVIYTQIDMHTEFGGVVPELASRAHIDKINYVVQKALNDAGKTVDEVDAIAVTYGPGLVGALLVVFVNQCLSFLSVSEAVRVIVTGLVLVLALSFSSLTSYAQRKEDSGK